MAYKKELRPFNFDNQKRAIESHSGFVSYVVGKVQKIGMEEVLKCDDPKSEYYWLKKYYDRVLNFAESVQLKMVPQEFTGVQQNIIISATIQKEVPGEPTDTNRVAEYFSGAPYSPPTA